MENKETLEEIIDNLFKKYSNNTSLAEGHYDYMMDKQDFTEASLELTKYLQDQDKLSEDNIRLDERCKCELENITTFSDGYEAGILQQERMYSEKEVVNILMKVYEDIGKRKIPNPVVLASWFEKHKKK